MLERGITPTSEELNERYQEGLVSIHKAYDMDLFDEQQRDEALAKHEEERGKPDSEYDLRITHILEESILTVKRFDVPAKHSKSHKTLEFAMDQLLLSVEAIRKSDYDVADQYLAVALKYIETWETIFRAE
jgi:hypothetical protein